MGGDITSNIILASFIVSIHAPVWGATTLSHDNYQTKGVSIHAPVWGATGMILNKWKSFVVSIHAPVWGATFQ